MTPVAVVIGAAPKGHPEQVLDAVQRAARHAGVDVLAGVPGDRLVVVLGGVEDPLVARPAAAAEFGAGPVVVGPTVADLGAAGASAGPRWPGPRGPRLAGGAAAGARRDLLAERALSGDEEARRTLVEDVYRPLAEAGSALLDTVTAYARERRHAGGAARALFVHPNTVRYRLRRVAEVCGRAPTDPAALLTLQLALVLGRLEAAGRAERQLGRATRAGNDEVHAAAASSRRDTPRNCRIPTKLAPATLCVPVALVRSPGAARR